MLRVASGQGNAVSYLIAGLIAGWCMPLMVLAEDNLDGAVRVIGDDIATAAAGGARAAVDEVGRGEDVSCAGPCLVGWRCLKTIMNRFSKPNKSMLLKTHTWSDFTATFVG